MATSSITLSRVWRRRLVRQRMRIAPPKLLLVARQLRRVDGAVALVEQLGDFEFARPRALAADFGRMSGEDRAHQRAVEERLERLRRDAGLGGAVEGEGERAGARR